MSSHDDLIEIKNKIPTVYIKHPVLISGSKNIEEEIERTYETIRQYEKILNSSELPNSGRLLRIDTYKREKDIKYYEDIYRELIELADKTEHKMLMNSQRIDELRRNISKCSMDYSQDFEIIEKCMRMNKLLGELPNKTFDIIPKIEELNNRLTSLRTKLKNAENADLIAKTQQVIKKVSFQVNELSCQIDSKPPQNMVNGNYYIKVMTTNHDIGITCYGLVNGAANILNDDVVSINVDSFMNTSKSKHGIKNIVSALDTSSYNYTEYKDRSKSNITIYTTYDYSFELIDWVGKVIFINFAVNGRRDSMAEYILKQLQLQSGYLGDNDMYFLDFYVNRSELFTLGKIEHVSIKNGKQHNYEISNHIVKDLRIIDSPSYNDTKYLGKSWGIYNDTTCLLANLIGKLLWNNSDL